MRIKRKVRKLLLTSAFPEGYRRTGPPLGIGYIASVLLNRGYDVEILDPSPLNMSLEDMKKEFQKSQPDIVGVYCCSTERYEAFKLAHAVKETSPDTVVVFGGPHPTALAEQIIERIQDVDLIVRNEGEITMGELVLAMEKGRNLATVEGLTFRDGNGVVSTPTRPFISDLDSLPFPAYSLYPPLNMYAPQGIAGKRCSGIIMSSRGCTFSCPFCYAPSFWGRMFRARGPKSVVDEMIYMRDALGVEFIKFFDDAFTLDMRRAEQICDEMVRRRTDLAFLILSRVDTISKTLLRKLRAAGCEEIQYGVESGSPRILSAIGKRITVERVEKVLRWTKDAGISTHVFMMQGLPGETIEDMESTFKFLRRNAHNIDGIESAMTMLLPDTPLYESAKKLGLVDEEVWFSFENENKYLQRDPFSRYLPPYLENFDVEELIKYHRLVYILFHLQKRRLKKALPAVAGYLVHTHHALKDIKELLRYSFK